MTQRQEVNKCGWKNGTNRLNQCRDATNLPSVKKTKKQKTKNHTHKKTWYLQSSIKLSTIKGGMPVWKCSKMWWWLHNSKYIKLIRTKIFINAILYTLFKSVHFVVYEIYLHNTVKKKQKQKLASSFRLLWQTTTGWVAYTTDLYCSLSWRLKTQGQSPGRSSFRWESTFFSGCGCVHTWQKRLASSLGLFYEGTNPFVRVLPSWPNQPPELPPPNTMTLGVMFKCMDWGKHTLSVSSTWYSQVEVSDLIFKSNWVKRTGFRSWPCLSHVCDLVNHLISDVAASFHGK